MTIKIRPEITYTLLKNIKDRSEPNREKLLKTCIEEDLGQTVTEKDFLGHLDYLNQKKLINADFSGDAYADKGPNPFPSTVTLQDAQITPIGESAIEKLRASLEESMKKAKESAIAPENMAFLEKVQKQANLPDIFDARDLSEVVFRTMRDVMPTSIADNVAEDLHQPASKTEDSIGEEVADLWMDTNPIVSFLSQIRQPLDISTDLFLRRIRQEGALPEYVKLESVIDAVFSATKDELAPVQINDIARNLPEGIREMWISAS